ncbi:MAG: aldo/keto reductase [Clostridia bacterium]
MKYRKFNGLDVEASVLGFGAMRLPVRDGDYSAINEPKAMKMLRHAIDSGVNYIDTAYPYHNGNSERFLAKVLKDGYREKVYLATKLPVGRLKEKEDMTRIFNEQMEKLEVDYLDFYLLHAVNRNSWETCVKLGVTEFIDELKAAGKIKYAGFSFHDSPEIFRKVADAYEWDMCQLQFNYVDTHTQAGIESFRYAADKKMNIVVMEPLRGGSLASNLPPELEEHFRNAEIDRSPVEWAFRWLYNFPEVKVILSGMNTMEQLKENLRIFDSAVADSMTEAEQRTMERAMEIMNEKTAVPCTDCKYCMPCPHGVNIPAMFGLYNRYTRFSNKDEIKAQYNEWRARTEKKSTADLCVNCGECLEKCPQSIQIPDKLAEMDSLLASK